MVLSVAPALHALGMSFPSPHFILRLGGLPVERMTELRTTLSAEWASEVLLLERELRRRSASVTDLLYQAVSRSEQRSSEHVLLSLKRDVFNLRLPKEIAKVRDRVARLPPEFSWPITDWIDLAEKYSRLLAGGGDVLAAEIAQKRRLLKSTLTDATFRKGLLLASSDMEQSIDAYVAASDTSTNRRLRTTERSALLYLYRTAFKTSPFSTLTPVAWGLFEASDHSNGSVNYEFPEALPLSDCVLNVAILSRLSAALLQFDDVWPELPISLNESFVVEGDRLRYLRRIWTSSDGAGPVAFDEVKEVPFYLPMRAAITQVFEEVGRAGTMTAGRLVERLTGPEPSGLPRREAITLVRLLMDVDLLVNTSLRVALTSEDPFAEFVSSLEGLSIPRVQELRARLKDVRASLTSFPLSSSDERRATLARVRQEVGTAFRVLDQDASELPGTIVYENAVCRFNKLSLPVEVWQPHLKTLADIQRLLPIFDASVGLKLAMKGFFKTVFGAGQRCEDVVSFVELFKHDYVDGYRRRSPMATGGAVPNPLGIPEIDLIETLRQRVTDHAAERFAERSDPTEVVLDSRVLEEVAALVPSHLRMPSSHNFAVQLAEGKDGSRLVVNRIYSGMGQLFSRFLWLLDRDGGKGELVRGCREVLLKMQPPGAVIAELLGGNDSNLNLHPELAPYEIVFPSSRSLRCQENQIPLSDLYLVHEPADDSLQLRSRRLGRQVIPLYLGVMLPNALPDIQQILLNCAISSYVFMPSLLRDVQTADDETIQFTPRVRWGDVVLERAGWRVPASLVPLRASFDSDADYFLGLTRWREEHGLAAQVFLKHDRGRPQAKAGEQPREAWGADGLDQMIRKPMYVDFANYLSVMLLDRVVAARGNAALRLTEVLPAEEHLWLRNPAGRYVSEFMIEMNLVNGPNA